MGKMHIVPLEIVRKRKALFLELQIILDRSPAEQGHRRHCGRHAQGENNGNSAEGPYGRHFTAIQHNVYFTALGREWPELACV